MESVPNVDQSAIINDTFEEVDVRRIDTWNEPRSDEALRSFVTSRTVRIGKFENLDQDFFDLAA